MEYRGGNVGEVRRQVLDLNLPPEEDTATGSIISGATNQVQEHGQSQSQSREDVEIIDDEVAIISPRTFVEARNKSTRNREGSRVRDEATEHNNGYSECQTCGRQKRKRSPENLEVNLNMQVNETQVSAPPQLPTIVPQPEALTYTCPICMEKLVDATTTRCGHVFCKKCIITALAEQKRCPTCRTRIAKRGLLRIYLPGSN